MRIAQNSTGALGAIMLTLALALGGCAGSASTAASSATTASSGSATSSADAGSSASATLTTARLPELLGSMSAAYVGHDQDLNAMAFGIGKVGDRSIAVLIDKENGEYHSWVGSYETNDGKFTITDDVTGETATFAATQDAGGSMTLLKEGIKGAGALVSCYGVDGVEKNLELYDKSLVDYEVSYRA